MRMKYEKVTKSGATVTVYGYLTFEGNPVMRIDHFHDPQKIGIAVPMEVEMKIIYPDSVETKHIGRISNEKVNAAKKLKLNIVAFKSLLESFENHGYDYIFTFQLNAL